jgi:hypothetical protein
LKTIAEEGTIPFCQKILKFQPTEYQRTVLLDFEKAIRTWRENEEADQFFALRWSRQSGKSHTVSALLLWTCILIDGFQWGVLGPSFRQSKLIIRRIATFLQKIPKEILIGRKPLRTKIAFTDGSTIEAFPNNPETIRGPTLHGVFADEMNFFKNDEEIYDAILFTLGAKNGFFICTSTPWSSDHTFYKICKDKDFDDFKRYHVTWQDALEPKGPLKKSILGKIRKQLAADPWRWQREMEAEWAEDENVWLSQSLIANCIDPKMEIRTTDRLKSFWLLEPER